MYSPPLKPGGLNNLYDKSRTNRSNGLQSTDVHSATTRSIVVGVIHMLTVDEFVDHTNTPATCSGEIF